MSELKREQYELREAGENRVIHSLDILIFLEMFLFLRLTER